MILSLKTAPTLFYIFKYVYVKLMRLPPPTYKGNEVLFQQTVT